jgi:hypothetical protein
MHFKRKVKTFRNIDLIYKELKARVSGNRILLLICQHDKKIISVLLLQNAAEAYFYHQRKF